MIARKTLIFFDEVQECKEMVTAIKFLADEGSYKYILSGSLLGVELKDLRPSLSRICSRLPLIARKTGHKPVFLKYKRKCS